MNDLVVEKIKGAFPDVIEEVVDFRGERTVIIEKEAIIDVARLLRDDEDLRFVFLEDIVADDYLNEYPRFYVSYQFYSIENKARMRVRVPVEDPDEGPKTLTALWKVASWLEMEVFDLMGIAFEGNGALRRLFLPEDWQGHPLRKDYPLGYEEVQFSFNYEEINAKKPYAKD
jgi:NADH-quinone oxidoreductase subunit C